jgi:xylulose-5-phosphate/fructose-6-phosphate phosphoketolase
VKVPTKGAITHENTKPFGEYLRDVMKNNPTNFRLFGPDETASNRLQAVYGASKKTWMADLLPEDADGGELARDGRVMEMLSEHTLLGWLEGYLLTGRHGFFHTYEAFAHVIDSMFNQHAKWLDISKNHVPWRASVASENILLSSTVWRQDHNGFSHQDPGFIDLVTNKEPVGDPSLSAARCQHAAVGRRPLPAQHRLRQRDRGRQAEAPAVHVDR